MFMFAFGAGALTTGILVSIGSPFEGVIAGAFLCIGWGVIEGFLLNE